MTTEIIGMTIIAKLSSQTIAWPGFAPAGQGAIVRPLRGAPQATANRQANGQKGRKSMKPNKEKQNLFETTDPNIKWVAGGKGICAFSSLWVLFEIDETAQTMKAIDKSIWTKPANGGWMRIAHFSDAVEVFDSFWEKIGGRVFPLEMDDAKVQKLLDEYK
jgi:hypothetical protein